MSKSSRRAFLGRLGTAAVVPALGSLSSSAFSFSAPAVASAEQGAAPRASYDLLIAGGRVIDPGQNLSAVRDVAILHGRVARIAENIPHTQARSVFDATDKIGVSLTSRGTGGDSGLNRRQAVGSFSGSSGNRVGK